ncbi:MAG: hypothetical protein M1546_20485 [Chloroflexi bacterium]|nr:hypothetical protein [Chloroflexota bacterium]
MASRWLLVVASGLVYGNAHIRHIESELPDAVVEASAGSLLHRDTPSSPQGVTGEMA